MTFISLISKAWENFFYMLIFIGLAIVLYKLMKWNTAVRKSKKMDEVTTKGNIIRNWMMIICLIFCAFVCFLRFIFNI